ncbi:MAG: TetR/AcrR family transcriptional regulator [Actinomycetota bacterium]
MSATAALIGSAAAPGDSTTEKILDATMAQFLDFGLRRTTVEDVAVRAGVSRVTIHRRFGRKNELIQGVMFRELSRFLAEFDATVSPLPTLEDKLVEGFVVTMRVARSHPLVTRILATEPEALLPELTVRGGPFLQAAVAFLVSYTQGDGEGYDADDVAAIGEIFVRLVGSFLLTPSSVVSVGDDASARRYAQRHLAPLLRTARRASVKRARRKS